MEFSYLARLLVTALLPAIATEHSGLSYRRCGLDAAQGAFGVNLCQAPLPLQNGTFQGNHVSRNSIVRFHKDTWKTRSCDKQSAIHDVRNKSSSAEKTVGARYQTRTTDPSMAISAYLHLGGRCRFKSPPVSSTDYALVGSRRYHIQHEHTNLYPS